MREFRIHPWLFAVVTMAAVVLIGVVAALITHLAHEGPEKQCVLNCPPPASRAIRWMQARSCVSMAPRSRSPES